MSDLITLNCPSCGGKLQVDPDSSTLTCNHCGNEHFVHREGASVTLESYARCPKCGRNDRVEKVSAILRSHKQEVTSTEQRTEVYIDQEGHQHTRMREVPKTYTQVTGLARVLIPPKKPDPIPKPDLYPRPNIGKPKSARQALKVILLITAILTIITFCVLTLISFGILFDQGTLDSLVCGIPSILLMLGGMGLFIFSLVMKPVDKEKLAQWEGERNQILEQWQNKNRQLLDRWKEANDRNFQRWQAAMENWQNLYYCHRDDCVFVPGKGTYAPIERLQEYLHQ